MEEEKVRNIFAVGSTVSFLIAFYIFSSQNISVATATNFDITLDFILYSSLGIAFIAIGLSFLTVMGLFHKNWKIGLISAAVACFIGGFLFNYSIAFLVLSAGILIVSSHSIMISSAKYEELKKWNEFRVGSQVVGKAITWVALFLILGIFITIQMNPSYSDTFKNSMEGMSDRMANSLVLNTCMSQFQEAELVEIDNVEEFCQEQIETMKLGEIINKELYANPMFAVIMQFGVSFILIFSIWAYLGFLNIFLSLIAGVVSFILIKFLSSTAS